MSKSVPSVLPIALECKDYKGYCVLMQLIKPISDNTKTNIIQRNEILRMLMLQGLPNEEIIKIINEGLEDYIEIKTIANDQVSSHSVKEIEDWFPEAKRILDSTSNVSVDSYTKLSERLIQMQKLYEVMRGYVISKLTYYQQTLKIMERKSNQNFVKPRKINMEKIFIVHGHNNEMKESIARLVERQGIQAIILHEQANQGGTIIEKIERNSDVGCAICLFTADDLGRAKNIPEEKKRARQNVIFEAGYFIGKLGRNKVVFIADQEVEMPSDLQGVVYVGSENWRFSILKELKAIGYQIDYEKLD